MREVGAKPGPATTSNIAGKLEHKLGDVDAGLRRCRRHHRAQLQDQARASRLYRAPRLPRERRPRTASATIWSSSQGHFMVRDMTAQLTGIKLSDVRAIPAEIGGGFGGKTIVYLEPLALVLARKSGRPVKMVMTREEVFRATGPTSGSSSTVKIGATKDGKITAVKATYRLQAGAFPGLAHPRRRRLRAFALRPRQRAHHRLRRRDEPAEGRGLPRAGRADRRLRGGVRARRTRPRPEDGSAAAAPEECGQAGHQGGLRPDVPRASATRRRWRRRSAIRTTRHRWVRTRAAASPAASGSMPAANPAPQVNVNEDGTVVVVTGHPDIGGSRASMVNIAAEMLGIDYRRCRP